METFYVVMVPTKSGRTWRIVRNDGRGGEALLPSAYATEDEARRQLEHLTTQAQQSAKGGLMAP
jgi:hypothetical protein